MPAFKRAQDQSEVTEFQQHTPPRRQAHVRDLGQSEAMTQTSLPNDRFLSIC